jgi:uncharacterized membrane protein YphA (DoxX/SURF4 family)
MKSRLILEWICRLIAGSIFVYASLNKITDPCSMAMDIYHYQILPGYLVNISAIILPYAELVFGLALIAGFLPRGAALGIILMLCLFTAALSFNLIRGLDIECGCFGSVKDLCVVFSGWVMEKFPGIATMGKVRLRLSCDIMRDVFFLAAAAGALLLILKRSDSASS